MIGQRSMERTTAQRDEALSLGNLRFEPRTRLATVAQRSCRLSGRESALLRHLLRQPGQAAAKPELLAHFVDASGAPSPAAVEVYVHRLRRLLDALGADVQIQTILGVGYVLVQKRGG